MSTPAVTPQFSVQDFAGRIRAQYPGAYDHLSDDDLTQRVVTKYPQYKGQIANLGLANPAAPATPQTLQQNPNWGAAAREGTLTDVMRNQAKPIAEAAQYAGSFMGNNPATLNRGLATGISGLGKTVGFAEKFLPWSKLSRGSEAIEEVSGGLAGKIRNYAKSIDDNPGFRKTLAEQMGGKSPRPALIQQMGGKPVEEMTDAALKQKMEQSSEVTYGQNAKRHAGRASASYPEPDQWQDQPPDQAPWGGRFYRR